MELWDAYDRNGNKTGEILVRGEPIPEGRYHLVSEVLVRHVDGSPIDCIRRELREETGIEWTKFEKVSRSGWKAGSGRWDI